MTRSDWIKSGMTLGTLVMQEMGKLGARQWLIKEAPGWLEPWKAETVAMLVEKNIGLWRHCLSPEIKEKALSSMGEHAEKIGAYFADPDEAADFLYDVLNEVRPDLVKVMPKEYLQGELEAILEDAKGRVEVKPEEGEK